jgi:predicted GTPase
VAEIQKWTSSKSVSHYFVKEVEVGLKEFELPEGVVLVDTPGLDDVVEYRSNITRDYIDRANAVLVCVKSDALTGQEMATIYSVFSNTRYNLEKVYIIATQIDTLNRPRENWMSSRRNG